MDSLSVVGLLIAGALALGFGYRFLHGRGHKVAGKERVDLARLKVTKNGVPTSDPGKKATLLQFSTEYCGQCPGVRRQLAQLEYRMGGLSHLEVDITDRIEIAAHFGISQTPTVFVLNPRGEIVYRVGGVPKLPLLMQELEKLGVK
ncbi:MAG: thioredoxin family protein [Aquiluna sp.]